MPKAPFPGGVGSKGPGGGSVKADGYVSITIPRPEARLAINGKRPFVAKKIGWKCCAAPRLGQKMYARVSNAGGDAYDNSYIGNVISWQQEPTVVYEFQAINFHFQDDDGPNIRCWLVSGGPFLYTPGPVGYLFYAQVALPPANFHMERSADDPNMAILTWDPWDVKADFEACGDTYSLSGYAVQIARDATFTEKVRTIYVSPAKGSKTGRAEVYGLYYGYDWYYRMGTRNEVSEHYKMPAGQWSEPSLMPKTEYNPEDPDPGPGPETSGEGGDFDPTDQNNNPNSTSGLNTSSPGSSASDSDTPDDTAAKNATKVAARTALLRQLEQQMQIALAEARREPTYANWNQVDTINASIKSGVNYIIARTTGDELAGWMAVLAQVTAADALINSAKAAALAAQTPNQQGDSGVARIKGIDSQIKTLLTQAQSKNTVASYQAVLFRLNDLVTETTAMISVTTANAPAAWTQAKQAAQTAQTAVSAAIANLTAASAAAAILAVNQSRTATKSALTVTTTVDADYSSAQQSVIDALAGLTGAVNATTLPLGDTGGIGGTTTTSTGAVIYSPIPDTSALRSSAFGTLISRTGAAKAPGHTVYLMDRGGRQRIGEFKSPTKISYNRIRDDQSIATLSLDGSDVRDNQTLLDQLSVGRHEICIYRGSERVWEGPITLATWKRDSVEISAKDITHYLNRTVLKAAYSNAYPNLTYVVDRIAGIMANELGVKESLTPPVNILPFVRTYVQEGDAKTTRVTTAGEMTLWQHLDDLAAKAGIDYTVIGRALHIWDTSRAALGRIRTVTENDFEGDTYISAYGMELATQTFVSDGQGHFGMAGQVDDYYGEIDLVAQAYDENGNSASDLAEDGVQIEIDVEELREQAERNLKGRNPTPYGLHVPDNSGFRLDRGIGMDVLIPGVYIPVSATLAGRTLNQTMKLKEIKVEQDASGERVSITMTPASSSDTEAETALGTGAGSE